jgi:DNA-binding transcriptional regulator GbsR (MarR family)
MKDTAQTKLQATRDEFVAQWGAMGSSWGINRTMAQIHALLMITPRALTTDEVMQDLKISRGNANTNLRELIGWGLIRSVIRKGERKEYFEAEKDVWKIFCTVAKERKRREIDPVLLVLRKCQEQTKELKGEDVESFNQQIKALADLVAVASKTMDRVSSSSQSTLLPLALKFLK